MKPLRNTLSLSLIFITLLTARNLPAEDCGNLPPILVPPVIAAFDEFVVENARQINEIAEQERRKCLEVRRVPQSVSPAESQLVENSDLTVEPVESH